MDRFITFVN